MLSIGSTLVAIVMFLNVSINDKPDIDIFNSPKKDLVYKVNHLKSKSNNGNFVQNSN